jgi:hypothetical protein
MRNLKDIEFHEKQAITDGVEARLANSNNNAYDLSKLILMAGLLGNSKLYDAVYDAMVKKLNGSENVFPNWVDVNDRSGVTTWLYGRISLAAYCMGSDVRAREFNKHIVRILENCPTPTKDFASWARSYQAISDPKEFYDGQKLIDEAHKSTMEPLWSWVMVIYAAAHQSDEKTYLAGWSELNRLSGLKTVAASFSPKSSSQAWALAMLMSAAQLIRDDSKVEGLTPLLRESIAHPETSAEDKMLAQLTFQLVKERARVESSGRSIYQYARGMFSPLISAVRTANTNHLNTMK